MSRLRPTTLTGGLCVAVLGLWMLLDDAGVVGMSLAAIGPALLATIGLTLLVSGLTRRE
ncbi:MAG TPA: hypothetical protein VFB41_01685 [Solirubrobacteraceae bacterium]|nr:hypothetical protein [Solirubrobacteraceae bacterium]